MVLSEILKASFKIILECWWIIIPVALFFIFKKLRLQKARDGVVEAIKWVLLEIKIPQEVQKTPKAMEQIFAGLHGVKGGKEHFSFEIISKGGDLHFLVRAPEEYRNIVEAQFYAQYPSAEISEVEDYVDLVPSKIPSKDHDIWGTELILSKEDAYPIKSYLYFFEESKEEERIDPLASLTEILASLTPEEHIWIQILIRPANDDWVKEGTKLVEKLTGKEVKATKKGLVFEEANSWLEAVIEGLDSFFFGPKEPAKKEEKKKDAISQLTSGEKEVISAVENNIAKLGFETSIRIVYWAKSDIFSGASKAAIIGAFKQFNTQNLNGFKPNDNITPSVDGLFKQRREFYRKINIINNYQKRHFPHFDFSSRGFVFNTEELATIFHAPSTMVKTGTISRVEAKKASPPAFLPTE